MAGRRRAPADAPGGILTSAYPWLVTHHTGRRTLRSVLCAALLSLTGCGILGFGPDYPADLPMPPRATKVVSDTGSDDDEPMRSRVQVLDVPKADAHDLLGFYEGIFPETRGWSPKSATEGQLVCLSRQSDDGFFEFVEVFTYRGSRVDERPDRFLAAASRFQNEAHCGSALAWVPLDLIE